MAHNLNKRGTGSAITMEEGDRLKAAGQQQEAALVYLKSDGAWHGLGVAVDGAMTVKEVLKLSGTDWKVNLGPIFDADMKQIDKKIGQRTYRSDNGVTLGVVGKRYTVIDNERGFEVLDDIVGKGNANFVTGGALGAGEAVFATVKLPEDIKIAGDIITPYFHVLLKHDGTGSTKVYAAPTRQVCENTVNFALNEAMAANRVYSIRHTVNYEARLGEAEKTLGVIRSYAEQLEQSALELLKQTWDKVMFEKLLNDLIPLPEEKGKKYTIAQREQSKLYSAYNASDLDNVRNTAWGVINAVADYSDHAREQRGDEATRAANKFLNTFTTQGSAIKDKALELILATK